MGGSAARVRRPSPSRELLLTGSNLSRAGGGASAATQAKLLVLLLAFAWGFNWISAAVGLREMPPWSFRFVGVSIGVITLFVAARLSRCNLAVPRGQRMHIMIAGFFNVSAFNILSAFAQLGTATSRVVIIAYSMPIWAALLARFALGERLNLLRMIALALCVAGLTVLVQPLFAGGLPLAVLYALGCALSWAIATIYLKWAEVEVEPLANAAWQLLFGGVLIGIGMLAVDGLPKLWPLQGSTLAALAYNGVIGVGLAHFLWWSIVGRLPTTTASLGTLLVPVVGVTASAVMLGERPPLTDIVGFALIFSAAACVLLQPHSPLPEKEFPE